MPVDHHLIASVQRRANGQTIHKLNNIMHTYILSFDLPLTAEIKAIRSRMERHLRRFVTSYDLTNGLRPELPDFPL